MPRPQQIPFPFEPVRSRYRREDYVFTSLSSRWLASLEGFLNAGETALALCGPESSGKTHLAAIVAKERNGVILDATMVATAPEDARFVVADNVERIESTRDLFALIERFRESGRIVILSGRGDPGGWAHGLRDLETRLRALPRVTLEEPDETLMRAVMARLFAVRQLSIPDRIIEYAAPRLPRTYAAAQRFVALADAEIGISGEGISIALVKRVIDSLSEGV